MQLVLAWLYIHFCFMARFKVEILRPRLRWKWGLLVSELLRLCGLSKWMSNYWLLCWRWLCG